MGCRLMLGRFTLRRIALGSRSTGIPRRQFSKDGLAILSGAPEQHLKRHATIYKPAREATQQGIANTEKWLLKFDKDSRRWANPLMGWTSGKQMSNQIKLKFDSKEEAVEYCELQGKGSVVSWRCLCVVFSYFVLNFLCGFNISKLALSVL